MPGFGVQFVKLRVMESFSLQVDGMSASNEIPRFLFCKIASTSGAFVEIFQMFADVLLVRILFGEGSKGFG